MAWHRQDNASHRTRSLGSRLSWSLPRLLLLVVALPSPIWAQVVSAPSGPSLGKQPAGKLPALLGSGPVVIKADRQGFDRQLGRVVASGHVEVTLNGWRLLADRIEFAEASRSLRASGQVRLQKGDQYLQASSLRYSDWEGSGELLDVYGVIDSDTLSGSLQTKTSGTAGGETSSPAPARSFACPPLVARPNQRQLPSIPAPPGCPGSTAAGRSEPLARSLQSVAMGTVLEPEAAPPIAADASPAERVRDVRFQQSLGAAVKLDLAAVVDTADSGSPTDKRLRPPKDPRGSLSRIRFQTSRLQLRGDRWSAAEVAFTNDPFTPAASWTIAQQVEAVVQQPSGVTTITAQRSRILLSERISVPGITRTTIGNEQARWAIDSDNRDRDGLYVGYNLPTIRLGRRGSLEVQPQFLLQRAVEGQTNSYVAPDTSLSSPSVTQSAEVSDLFGLNALLKLPVGGMQFNSDLSLSTFNPSNLRDGTRSKATLSRPLGLSWAPEAAISLFTGYRERIYNGSLGLEDLIYAYGARLSGGSSLPLSQPETSSRGPGFLPLQYSWQLQSGNYRSNLFETDTLATLWRSDLNLSASTTLQLWRGESLYTGQGTTGLRYSPIPVVPGFGLDMGLTGNLARYSDDSRQNSLTLWGGPSFTLGHFEKPWFDYTRFSVSLGGTLIDGASPFAFDRVVDRRTLSFRASQQIYGPLVVEGGASFNIDPSSQFYGESSYSYVEVKLQRRSYEIGIYYSPYEGIGGIRLKLNDFNFNGTGSPFVPRPQSPSVNPEAGA